LLRLLGPSTHTSVSLRNAGRPAKFNSLDKYYPSENDCQITD
jgi:hypothetical protein